MKKLLILICLTLVFQITIQAQTHTKDAVSPTTEYPEDTLSALPDETENIEIDQVKEGLIDTNSGNKKDSRENIFLSLIGIIIAIGSCALSYVILRRSKVLDKQFEYYKSNVNKKLKALTQNLEEYENKLSVISFQYNVLLKRFEKEASKPTTEISEFENDDQLFYTEDNVKNVSGIPVSKIPEEKKTMELYVGIPISGEFTNSSQKYLSGRSIYKIIYKGGTTASYEFIDTSEAVTIAKRSTTRFLESGCIIQGQDVLDFKRVKTIRPGSVRKTPSGWTIINKAVVELL